MENQSKNKTIVTIIVLSYNHAAFIHKCLSSVVAQVVDFDLQVIITDDCSTDNTQSVINDFIEGADTPFHFDVIMRQKNVGLIQNYFEATEKAKGKYIATISGDDYWLDPNKISKQVLCLNNNPTYAVCFTHYKKLINSTNQLNEIPLPQKRLFNHQDIARENAVIAGTAMYRKNLLALLPQDKSMFLVEDWLMWWFFSQDGYISMLPDVTLAYRMHENNIYASISWAKMRALTLTTKAQLNSITKSVSNQQFLRDEKEKFVHVLTSSMAKEEKEPILNLFINLLPKSTYKLRFFFMYLSDPLFKIYFKIIYRIIYKLDEKQ